MRPRKIFNNLVPVEQLQLGFGDVDGFVVDDPGHRLPAPGIGSTALVVSKLFTNLSVSVSFTNV